MTHHTTRLKGKVAVITGAGRGIGAAEAILFAQEGAKVVVNDLGGGGDGSGASKSPAEEVVAEIKKMGGEAVANYESVATTEGGEKIIKSAIDAFGRLDILVNNAGILRDRMIYNMSPEEWDIVMKVPSLRDFQLHQARLCGIQAAEERPHHQHCLRIGLGEHGAGQLQRCQRGHSGIHQDRSSRHGQIWGDLQRCEAPSQVEADYLPRAGGCYRKGQEHRYRDASGRGCNYETAGAKRDDCIGGLPGHRCCSQHKWLHLPHQRRPDLALSGPHTHQDHLHEGVLDAG